MRENKEQLIKDILMVAIICIVATIFVYQISKAGTESRINVQLRSKISTDSLKMDSLKMKITHDSLAHVDSLRVAYINGLKNKDNENKMHRDQDVNTIVHATDKQLDSLWAIYSPKISD